ncbi:FAD binding domain-containing protein [Desulfosporosinus hippei]|uniref:Carbon-monoxide dehydrogenase medium subunit n=1 Tax=Desulfosporosinus hippei DSM 8344 TaxID=1121419 RepID=A0A1G8H7B5_9FIRM|nr:FAD binding domain-containing protein [Desulfosporosinus hippei]SDI02548.1 carbon-monoxide dehydrogenase medium subunit [Desulfosporosinus hippei DSM 8344]
MARCEVVCPTTVAESLEKISGINENVVFLNGGTDLVIKLQTGQLKPAHIMDLSLISELNFIKEVGGRIKIGSGTTFAQISESDLIRSRARCLSQAASQVGSAQIRNRATIGGNIANAAAAADSLPALLALEAWISIAGPKGSRRIPFAQLQSGGVQGLQEKELILEIDFPIVQTPGRTRVKSAFGKIGSRTAVSVARLNMAALLEYDVEEQRILNSRWGVGALGPTPFRLEELEKELQGRRVDGLNAEEIADYLTGVVDQAIPDRASQEYKRQAIRGLVYDLLADLSDDYQS